MRRLLTVLGLSLLAGCASEPPRKYVVFFANSSVELDDASRNVIAEASAQAQKHASHIVQVEGYAGAGNDLSADALLAVQRAKLVAQQLHDDGVSGDRIRQTPRAPSSTEGSTVGSRRVEIELVSP
ncbi:OmpA family protein [Acetobacter sp.]|uniref:OmpA family protein n=1 Tax=Acetobacter sp. TaxID=440 RepID=UPI0039E8DF33